MGYVTAVRVGAVPAPLDPEKLRRTVAALMAALVVVTGLAVVPRALERDRTVGPNTDTPAELSDSDWASVRAQMDAARYHFQPGPSAWPELGEAVVAGNPAAGLDATLTTDLLRINPTGDPAAAVDLALAGVGRPDAVLPAPALAAPVTIDGTASIDRGNVVEWYRNDSAGFEQGFTVRSAPVGEGPLVVELAVAGATPVLDGEDDVRLLGAGGTATATYGGLSVFDADGDDLAAHLVVDGAAVRIVVDDDGARYPIVIDPLMTTSQTLKPQADAAFDHLGAAVDAEGDLLVVAAPGDDDTDKDVGTVQVFRRQGDGSWQHEATLEAPDPAPGEGIGGTPSSVSVNQTGVVAVGSVNVTAPDAEQAGAVYVWAFVAGEWTYLQELRGIPAADARFGTSVDQSSSGPAQLVVGAPGELAGRGAVYVYDWNGAGFNFNANLSLAGAAPGDAFGTSVAMDDATRFIAGAPGADPASVSNAGAAYHFAFLGGAWQQTAEITATPPLVASAAFGTDVAMWGDLLVAGAPGTAVGTEPGRAFRFSGSGTGPYTPIGELTAAVPQAGDMFGSSVDIDLMSITYTVGAPGFDTATSEDAGQVHVFRFMPGLVAQSVDGADRAGAEFGRSVSAACTASGLGSPPDFCDVFGGAPFDQSDAGENGAETGFVRRFSAVGGAALTETQVLAPRSDAHNDLFGYTISQAFDLLAVAAPGTQVGPADWGAVYVYARSAGEWVLETVLTSPPGNPTPMGAGFGEAVSIAGSGAGPYVLIGAPREDVDPDGPGGPAPVVSAAGSAYLWRRGINPGDPWTFQRKFVAPSPEPLGAFGYSVALAADILIGQPGDDNAGGADAGSVAQYFGNGASWTLAGILTSGDPGGLRRYGSQIAVGGTGQIAIGSPGAQPMRVDAYRRITAGPLLTHLQTINTGAPTAAENGENGLDIRGNRIAIGSPVDNTVRTFITTDFTTGPWVPEGTVDGAEVGMSGLDGFGYHVSLARGGADGLVVTAPTHDAGPANLDAGVAFHYTPVPRGDGTSDFVLDLRLDARVPERIGGYGYSSATWPSFGGVAIASPGAAGFSGEVATAPVVWREQEAVTGIPLGEQAYFGWEDIRIEGNLMFVGTTGSKNKKTMTPLVEGK